MSIRQKSGFSPLPGRDAFAACQAAGTFSRAAHGGFFAHCVSGGVLPALQAGSAICAPHSIYGFLHPPLLFLSAKEKEERRARCRRKRGQSRSVCSAILTGAERLFAKHRASCGLCPNGFRHRCAFASVLRHLRVQNLCLFARVMLSRSKAAISVKVSNRFQFPLWRIIRMCIFSLSAAAPWAKRYLLHEPNSKEKYISCCLTIYNQLSGSGAVGGAHAKELPNSTAFGN